MQGVSNVFNLKDIYEKANIDDKNRIIGSIFPQNMIFEENDFRTENINKVINWILNNSKGFERLKKGQPAKKSELSNLVVPPVDDIVSRY